LSGEGQCIVVGCGGAGCNTVARLRSISDMPALTINADSVSGCDIVMAPEDVRGCRGDADLGWALASDFVDEISRRIADFPAVVVTAGLGGGTGTGAAPIVAECAASNGSRVVAAVSVPMGFEASRRRKALSALPRISETADRTVVLDIGMIPDMDSLLRADEAVRAADELLCESIMRISDIMHGPLLSTMPDRFYTMAFGEDRDPAKAAIKALSAPMCSADQAGRTVVHVDRQLQDDERADMVEAICGRTNHYPEVFCGRGRGETAGVMLFIPILAHEVF